MRSFLVSTALLATAYLSLSSPAHATLSMMVGSTVIIDNGAGDIDPRTGVISYVGTVGNFNMNLSTQTGSFSADPLVFDLASTLMNSSGAGTLTIKLTSTDMTSPAAATPFLTQFSGNFTSGGATLTAQSYFDASNTAFGTTTPLASLSAAASPFALSSSTVSPGGTPFSLTEIVTITTTGPTSFSLDTSVSVPEPTSVMLIGTGLIGLGLLRKRRKG